METQIFWQKPTHLEGEYVVVQDPLAAQHTPKGILSGAKGIITLQAHGEEVKSLAHAADLYTQLARIGLKREGCLLGVGGGTLGDLVGFVAATWLRGVRYALMPTTLLAMVDSSIGGKTAVNLPEGKNLVGAFHKPWAVFIDTDTLGTLPHRAFAAGMAEAIKLSLIREESFLCFLEKNSPFHARHPELLALIRSCVETKTAITTLDPLEKLPASPNSRKALGFGHAIAHAIEHANAYHYYLHGEAVAIGLCSTLEAIIADAKHPEAALLAAWARKEPTAALERVRALLRTTGLPVVLD